MTAVERTFSALRWVIFERLRHPPLLSTFVFHLRCLCLCMSDGLSCSFVTRANPLFLVGFCGCSVEEWRFPHISENTFMVKGVIIMFAKPSGNLCSLTRPILTDSTHKTTATATEDKNYVTERSTPWNEGSPIFMLIEFLRYLKLQRHVRNFLYITACLKQAVNLVLSLKVIGVYLL